ncbi:MAG: hypothetical protein PHO92_04150 [Candidatus Peribacteraceae bacterium]|nr:hypothetical protein [Candidatus Peribacteraceae bacterium]
MHESPTAEHSVFTIRLAGLQRRCSWEDAIHLIGEASGIAPERRDDDADRTRAAIREELQHVIFRNTFTGIEDACPEPRFYTEPVLCSVRGVLCTTTEHEGALSNGALVEPVPTRQVSEAACAAA